MSCWEFALFHSILSSKVPVRLASIGIDEYVSRVPTLIGQGTVTSHRGSTVGVSGIKLYVVVYVAVAPSATVIS